MEFVFTFEKFSFDFLGHLTIYGEKNLGSIGAQIKSTMLVTLWAFIGIEGAVVLSGRAKSQQDVGRATILGFSGGLIIFALISILPYGFMTQAELAAVPNPSTAGGLEAVVGPWGSWLMNIGLIIAVLASWLAWTMITAEIPYAAGKDGTFPGVFARQNSKGSACVSLWSTSILMQLAMLLVYFSNDAWNTMLSITGVMVLPPYLASCLFLWKIGKDNTLARDAPDIKIGIKRALISGVLGAAFALWLIYAAGLQYLLVSIIFLAAGIPVYVWARKQHDLPSFTRAEAIGAAVLVAVAALAIILMATGKVDL